MNHNEPYLNFIEANYSSYEEGEEYQMEQYYHSQFNLKEIENKINSENIEYVTILF